MNLLLRFLSDRVHHRESGVRSLMVGLHRVQTTMEKVSSPFRLDWTSYRYLNALLWFLVVAVLEPFFLKNGHLPLGALSYALLVASCALAVGTTKKRVLGLALFAVITIFESLWLDDWSIAGQVLSAFFFALCAVLLLVDLWYHEEIILDTFFGAILCLLLIALGFAFCFYFIERNFPGSFNGVTADTKREAKLLHFLYFSFVNISSLGYGDIVPLNPGARNLAGIEGVTGQFYFACLVARLVGMHNDNKREKSPEQDLAAKTVTGDETTTGL